MGTQILMPTSPVSDGNRQAVGVHHEPSVKPAFSDLPTPPEEAELLCKQSQRDALERPASMGARSGSQESVQSHSSVEEHCESSSKVPGSSLHPGRKA